jgi:hypothetical protein
MDDVNFAWDKCHAPSVHAFEGKENFPTAVYKVTTNNACRAMFEHGPFPGARNDKNNAKTYHAVRAVRYNSSMSLAFI